MTHREWERLGAACGIIGVLVMMTAFVLPGTVATDATAEEIKTWVLDNRSALLAQAVLIGAAMLLFLMFLATFRNVLRRTEGGTGELSAVMSGSALVFVAMILTCVGVSAGAAYRSAEVLDANLVRLVSDIITGGFAFAGVPMAVFLGSAAVLMRRSDAFPAWMPAIAWIGAAACALGPASLFFDSGAWGPYGLAAFVPPVLFMLAVVCAAGAIVRHPEAGEARMPASAMASPA